MNTLNSKLRDLASRASHLYKYATQRIFKGNVGNDEAASYSEGLRENDAATNAETRPPEDEHVDLPCMWAVEFYTPSQVDKLVESLQRLGWDRNDRPAAESPISWLKSSRQRSIGDSWLNLGTILPPDDTRPSLLPSRTAPMPLHVSYATGSLHTITPSLTCIAIRFTFDEKFRSRLEEAVRQNRQTVTRPTNSSHQILDPWRQKENEVHEIRIGCKELAARWFRENLPGVFSSGLLGKQLPTYELITLRKAEPFPIRDGEEFPPPNYLRVLGLATSTSVWSVKEVPSLKFSWGLGGHNPQYHSVFVVKDSDVEETQILEGYGGVAGLPGYIDIAFNTTIGKLALAPLLDGYHRHLNNLRDTISMRVQRPSRHSPLQALEEILRNSTYEVDITAVTTDLISATTKTSWFEYDLKRFESFNHRIQKGCISENFRLAINGHALRLKQTDESLRDHMTQFGSLIAAKADVRTQNRIFWLTLVLAAVGITTLLTADVDSPLVKWIQDIWARLGP